MLSGKWWPSCLGLNELIFGKISSAILCGYHQVSNVAAADVAPLGFNASADTVMIKFKSHVCIPDQNMRNWEMILSCIPTDDGL